MKISLSYDEVMQALTNFVGQIGISTEGKRIELDVTAGRGVNKLKVDINLVDVSIPEIGETIAEPVSSNVEPSETPEVPAEDLVEVPESELVTEEEEAEPASLFGAA